MLAIDDATMAGEARRAAVALAGRLGFDETERGKVAIVATEAATNLSKHATGGEIVILGLESGTIGGAGRPGPGPRAGHGERRSLPRDGYSTAGSPGAGLGAMARLAAPFDIHSLPGLGTASVARLWAEPRPEGRTLPAWTSGQ